MSAVEDEEVPRRRIPVAAAVVPVVALVVAVYLEVALAIDQSAATGCFSSK